MLHSGLVLAAGCHPPQVAQGGGKLSLYQRAGGIGLSGFGAVPSVDNPFAPLGERKATVKVAFADVDDDGDVDALVGDRKGLLSYYRLDSMPGTAARYVLAADAHNPFYGMTGLLDFYKKSTNTNADYHRYLTKVGGHKSATSTAESKAQRDWDFGHTAVRLISWSHSCLCHCAVCPAAAMLWACRFIPMFVCDSTMAYRCHQASC